MKKIKKYPHLFYLWLTRPYPFQLWVAPRKKKWCFSRPEAEPKRKSPPGFPDDYAMYLYPDSIHTYWLIYFLSSVCLHFILDIFFITDAVINPYRYLAGILLYAISYQSISILYRKPVLDNLWPFWPETEDQKEYFKSIPSRITLDSCDFNDEFDCKIYLFSDIASGILKNLIKISEDLFFCRYTYLKSIHYFSRPVFFNPSGSVQEGLLRAAIADLFAVKEKGEFIKNIIIYYFPHVWISFIYLLVNLLLAFRWHPYKNQNETISLVILIIAWSAVSIVVIFKQYISIQLLHDYDEKFFKFSPKIVEIYAKGRMATNKDFVRIINPEKTFPVINTFAIAVYLVILNLVMQYAEPRQNNKAEIDLNIKKKCSQLSVKVIESDICEKKVMPSGCR